MEPKSNIQIEIIQFVISCSSLGVCHVTAALQNTREEKVDGVMLSIKLTQELTAQQ